MLNNQELAVQLYESFNTIIEAENELFEAAKAHLADDFVEISRGLLEMLSVINDLSANLVKEEEALSIDKAIPSIIDSLGRVVRLFTADYENALKKIEYELIPLSEECRINFFFWGLIKGDKEKEKRYFEHDIYELADNKYIKKSVETGNWKYDLSIFVIAFNKLDYTKTCIDYLQKNYPRWLRTELILINHGSDDGTKEFFETLNPDKQLDIKVNGGGLTAINRIVEGQYTLLVSNDVFIQRNAIKNLYDCISSDEKIAYVVPTTPNVSNLQSIPAIYSDINGLEQFIIKNNVKDSYRWEQRTRLCNPIDIVNNEFVWRYKPDYQFFSENPFSFPDDNMSLLCRRNGYKMFLLKDSFCHHCGSLTLKDDSEVSSGQAFEKGRKDFFERYSIDPWFKCAYSYTLFNSIKFDRMEKIKVIAVNGGFGSNGLKIKETLKENVHNTDVYLKYALTDDLYLQDVKYLGNEAVIIDSLTDLLDETEKCDYLIIEDIAYSGKICEIIKKLIVKICNESAMVIFEIDNKYVEDFLSNFKDNADYSINVIHEDQQKDWIVIGTFLLP